MNTLSEDVIEVVTDEPVRHSIIWLHGLGADATDFLPLSKVMAFPTGVRFVFPNAPVRPITLQNGLAMRGWYDLLDLGRIHGLEDEAGLLDSMRRIHALIDLEIERGIPSERVFLGGFSQGCAMTLLAGLRYDKPLGGLVALSGYLPLWKQTEQQAHPANRQVPIFMAHGQHDTVLDMSLGTFSRDHLHGLGYAVQWKEYAMAHAVCAEEVRDIHQFLLHYMETV